jgi:hypothetical protein
VALVQVALGQPRRGLCGRKRLQVGDPARAPLGQRVLDRRGGERDLVREVRVERPVRESGVAHHVPDGGTAEPFLAQPRRGRGNDPLACRALALGPNPHHRTRMMTIM